MGMHIAHNCPKTLIDRIDIETTLPDFGDKTVIFHNDGNTICVEGTEGKQVCTSELTEPKYSSGTQSGNDAGIWIPSPYDESTLPWQYAYFIQRTVFDPNGGNGS